MFSHEREQDIAQTRQSPRAGPCSVSCPLAFQGKAPGTPGLSDQALHHHPWGVCQQASEHRPGYRPEGCLRQGAVLEKGPKHLLTEHGSLPVGGEREKAETAGQGRTLPVTCLVIVGFLATLGLASCLSSRNDTLQWVCEIQCEAGISG